MQLFKAATEVSKAAKRTNSDNYISLNLECLESRDVPALLDGTAIDLLNNPPEVQLDDPVYIEKRIVTISGTVLDEAPGGLSVQISGQITGNVVTDSQGDFTLTAEAAGLGNVYARTTDRAGQDSNVDSVLLTSEPPKIRNQWAAGSTTDTFVVVFSGSVMDEDPSGLTVTIKPESPGAPRDLGSGTTATSDDRGTFVKYFAMPHVMDNEGVIEFQVTDWWGLTSEVRLARLSFS